MGVKIYVLTYSPQNGRFGEHKWTLCGIKGIFATFILNIGYFGRLLQRFLTVVREGVLKIFQEIIGVLKKKCIFVKRINK
jgi:hypothetical protein